MTVTQARRPGKALAIAAALVAVALWASSFAVMKKLLALGLPPLTILWLRMAIAALLLLPLAVRYWPQARPQKGDGWWLLLLAVCEPGLYFLLEITALQYTSSAQAGLIVAVFPLLAALGGALFFKERLTRRIMAGLALAISGAAAMSLLGAADEHAPNPWLGNMLEFLAITSAVGYMLLVKRLSGHWPVWLITAVQMTLGALFFLPGLPALMRPEVQDLLRDPEVWGLVLYLGAAVTVLAYGFYNFSVSRLSAAQAGVFINLIPVLAALIGWAWLGERLTGGQALAALLILAGVVLAETKRDKA